MKDDTTIIPFHQPDFVADPLTEIAREGARRRLAEALKAEADAFVVSFAMRPCPMGASGWSDEPLRRHWFKSTGE